MIDQHTLSAATVLQRGKYKIVRELGHGSFGITYLAKTRVKMAGVLGEMETEIDVAIKEFFMSDINTRAHDGTSVEGSSGSVFTNYRRKFRKEAENLARLSHDNIVRVIDVFDENNTTYYVMQYVEGGSLDEYIAARGRLSEQETFTVLRNTGDALRYMHSHKMLHLDLKPRNIMRRASDGHIFLIDFGLSKHFTDNGEPESSTTVGHGTPGYAPLEQAKYRGDGSFPATLDVYALGATAFKMLTGKRPPEASDILNDGFPSNDLLSLGISRSTVECIERAMSAGRRQRYQTVDAFLSALGCADRSAADRSEDTVSDIDSSAAQSSKSESADTGFEETDIRSTANHFPHSTPIADCTIAAETCDEEEITLLANPANQSQLDYIPPTTFWGCWKSAWRNKFNFNGRASLREFCSVGLVMFPILFLLVWCSKYIVIYVLPFTFSFSLLLISSWLLFLILFTIGLEIRRLRDAGRSVWWAVVFNVLLVIVVNLWLYDAMIREFYSAYFAFSLLIEVAVFTVMFSHLFEKSVFAGHNDDTVKRGVSADRISTASRNVEETVFDGRPQTASYVPPTTYWGCWKSAWRNKLNFKGRASRREFWCVFIPLIAMCVGFLYAAGITYHEMFFDYSYEWGSYEYNRERYLDMFFPFNLTLFVLILSTVSLEFRRLRDAGRSVWWAVWFNVLSVVYVNWCIYDTYFVGAGIKLSTPFFMICSSVFAMTFGYLLQKSKTE